MQGCGINGKATGGRDELSGKCGNIGEGGWKRDRNHSREPQDTVHLLQGVRGHSC